MTKRIRLHIRDLESTKNLPFPILYEGYFYEILYLLEQSSKMEWTNAQHISQSNEIKHIFLTFLDLSNPDAILLNLCEH